MEQPEYIYQNRVVAFLDVLGFQEKLYQFENEANEKLEQEKNEDFENLDKGQILQSAKANEFINTFIEAISKVDKEKFSCYLFSDNICITVNYGTDKSVLIELLMLISDLFYSFAQKGYFLRGGIDYGKFINQETIAIGVPLITAYKLETNIAIYPRIVISENFKKIFDEYKTSEEYQTSSQVFIKSFILSSCEINYLNVFLKVLNTDDKETYFLNIHNSIKQNLEENKMKEKIYVKYDWLASEFNNFIDVYTSELAFVDENDEPTTEFIEKIKLLNISHHAN
ncbi:MAG: hypothetical protein ACYDCN_00375 [Bacteroidia bacterium]